MRSKRRISKQSPSYYVPLPYAMAIRKLIDDHVFETHVFEGMKLELRIEGVINQSIAIQAHFLGEDHTIGYIPKGMLSRIEGLMTHDEKIVVSVEKKQCDRLKNAFWICIDELPDLPAFSF